MADSNPPSLLSRRLLLAIAFGYLIFVIYGSLVPLNFRPLPLDQAWSAFRNLPYLNLGIGSRADWIANIVLYVPLAFLWLGALWPKQSIAGRWLASILTLIFCLALSMAIEFTQIFFPPRTVSMNDLLAETLGTLIGIGLWILGHRRIARLGDAFAAGGRPSVLAGIIVYGLLYVALSLFPYDFIISSSELAWKLASDRQGWLIGGNCSDGFRCLAHLTGETLAIAPLGLLIALAAPGLGYRRVFTAGIILGLVLEFLQLLTASGVSQGLSVLFRGVGLAGGFALGQALHRHDPTPIARIVWRATPFAAPPYVLSIATLAGWFAAPWLPLGEALTRLADVRLMPFYYHYYTSEPAAMASLLANAAMYAPVGVVLWAHRLVGSAPRHQGAWHPALWAAALALPIELGKLLVPVKHPDLTNTLIAAAGAAMIYALVCWIERVSISNSLSPNGERVRVRGRSKFFAKQTLRVIPCIESPSPLPSPPGGRGSKNAIPTPVSLPQGSEGIEWPSPGPIGVLLSITTLLMALMGLVIYPLGTPWLGLALLGYGILLWNRPSLWLFGIPALLPVLDLSPFTGRLLLDEFDLLVLVTLAVGYWRVYGLRPVPWPHRGFPAAIALLWATWMIATARGLWPLPGLDGGFLASSHSPLETWLVGKGLLWALLLIPLLRRLPGEDREGAQHKFLNGLTAGLVVVTLAVLWERQVFVGLGDFESTFRVTGTFSSMHTGGAYIEAFIAFAFPALTVWVLMQRHWGLRLAGLLAAALAGYAMLVTFSRGGYAGLVVGLGVVAWGMLRLRTGMPRRRVLALAGLTVALIAVAVPVLSGGFAQHRLTLAGEDLAIREAHWGRALGLMDDGVITALTGMGFGQYPIRYLFGADPVKPPGTFSVIPDNDNPFLRLGAGEAVFLDQRVNVRPGERYILSAQVRQPYGEGLIKVALCEKALLYSFECTWNSLNPATSADGWSTMTVDIDAGDLGGGGNWPHRPVKLSLHNPGSHSPIDVDDISLKTADGRELLANGNFSSGVRHWLFVTDRKQAWHIDQQWVEMYFAQGLLGIVAMGLLLISVAVVLWPAVLAGNLPATAFAGALIAFLTVGLLGSTMDTARLSMLFYLGAFFGGLLTPSINQGYANIQRSLNQQGDIKL